MTTHAEKCPVCDGKGSLGAIEMGATNDVELKKLCTMGPWPKCHGCAGKGWIAVEDSVQLACDPTGHAAQASDTYCARIHCLNCGVWQRATLAKGTLVHHYFNGKPCTNCGCPVMQ